MILDDISFCSFLICCLLCVVLYSSIMPLQGCFNAVVYFRPKYTAQRNQGFSRLGAVARVLDIGVSSRLASLASSINRSFRGSTRAACQKDVMSNAPHEEERHVSTNIQSSVRTAGSKGPNRADAERVEVADGLLPPEDVDHNDEDIPVQELEQDAERGVPAAEVAGFGANNGILKEEVERRTHRPSAVRFAEEVTAQQTAIGASEELNQSRRDSRRDSLRQFAGMSALFIEYLSPSEEEDCSSS